MADALALLDELEASEAAKKPQKQQRKSKLASSYVSYVLHVSYWWNIGIVGEGARVKGYSSGIEDLVTLD